MNLLIGEMRREERRRAEGVVRIRFANPRIVEIGGHLVDVSRSGFRMSHACVNLASGQEVEFEHPELAGRARVIWNRLSGDRVETGFLVIG